GLCDDSVRRMAVNPRDPALVDPDDEGAVVRLGLLAAHDEDSGTIWPAFHVQTKDQPEWFEGSGHVGKIRVREWAARGHEPIQIDPTIIVALDPGFPHSDAIGATVTLPLVGQGFTARRVRMNRYRNAIQRIIRRHLLG